MCQKCQPAPLNCQLSSLSRGLNLEFKAVLSRPELFIFGSTATHSQRPARHEVCLTASQVVEQDLVAEGLEALGQRKHFDRPFRPLDSYSRRPHQARPDLGQTLDFLAQRVLTLPPIARPCARGWDSSFFGEESMTDRIGATTTEPLVQILDDDGVSRPWLSRREVELTASPMFPRRRPARAGQRVATE